MRLLIQLTYNDPTEMMISGPTTEESSDALRGLYRKPYVLVDLPPEFDQVTDIAIVTSHSAQVAPHWREGRMIRPHSRTTRRTIRTRRSA